jgi:hypothetical protein
MYTYIYIYVYIYILNIKTCTYEYMYKCICSTRSYTFRFVYIFIYIYMYAYKSMWTLAYLLSILDWALCLTRASTSAQLQTWCLTGSKQMFQIRILGLYYYVFMCVIIHICIHVHLNTYTIMYMHFLHKFNRCRYFETHIRINLSNIDRHLRYSLMHIWRHISVLILIPIVSIYIYIKWLT